MTKREFGRPRPGQKEIRTFSAPETGCPWRGHRLNSLSDPGGLNSPSEGDISICIACANFLQIGKGLALTKLEPESLAQIQAESPSDYWLLERYRQAILKVKGDQGDGVP